MKEFIFIFRFVQGLLQRFIFIIIIPQIRCGHWSYWSLMLRSISWMRMTSTCRWLFKDSNALPPSRFSQWSWLRKNLWSFFIFSFEILHWSLPFKEATVPPSIDNHILFLPIREFSGQFNTSFSIKLIILAWFIIRFNMYRSDILLKWLLLFEWLLLTQSYSLPDWMISLFIILRTLLWSGWLKFDVDSWDFSARSYRFCI